MKYDQDIEQLLPWYVKDLLSDEEKSQVERYLAEHPEMRAQLLLIEDENVASQQVHDALGGPLPGGLDRLMARIDGEEGAAKPSVQIAKAGGGLLGRIGAIFDAFPRPVLQVAGMAAAVVIVAQATIIGGLLKDGSDGAGSGADQQVAAVQDEPMVKRSRSFRTASGPEAGLQSMAEPAKAIHGAKLLIAFAKDAKMSDVNGLLKAKSAKIVAGPKAGGMYEIVVAQAKLPEGGVKALVKDLAQQKMLVKFVSVTK